MRNIALFHHSRLSGGDPPIAFDWAVSILAEQIIAMRDSGLSAAASELYFGVNGGKQDAMAVQSLVPDGAQVVQHPDEARGEHPTLRMMQQWARTHPNTLICYLHTKGATHPRDPLNTAWQRCMSNVVIGHWEKCINALAAGFDAAGAHWVGPQCAAAPIPNFFAGNFFWVTSDFIATVPLIAPSAIERLHFYDAEVLIARGPRPARAMDFARHWPGAKCLEHMNHEQH